VYIVMEDLEVKKRKNYPRQKEVHPGVLSEKEKMERENGLDKFRNMFILSSIIIYSRNFNRLWLS
jgi:hypothetical protein